METINPHQEYIGQVTTSLTDESMALIDFDALREWLCKVAPLLSDTERLQNECAALREDMVGSDQRYDESNRGGAAIRLRS